jgi:hypothetical protein
MKLGNLWMMQQGLPIKILAIKRLHTQAVSEENGVSFFNDHHFYVQDSAG